MGVFGLLSFCKERLGDVEAVDLFLMGEDHERGGGDGGGVELIVDYQSFLCSAVLHSHLEIQRHSPQWTATGFLGGQYRELDDVIKRFITRLNSHNVEPVFIDDGPRGVDKALWKAKLQTWIQRHDMHVEHARAIASYLENMSDNGGLIELSMLADLQAKLSIRRCGARIIVCRTEADDEIGRYLQENPKAFAILANDSDFCAMKGCRVIIDTLEAFDWDVLLSKTASPQTFPVKVWTVENTIAALGLQDHAQLVDVCILTGNDFTRPYHTKIWSRETPLTGVVATYCAQYPGHKRLQEWDKLQTALRKEEGLLEAIEISYKFYNLTRLSETSRDDSETTALGVFIAQNVEQGTLPEGCLAFHEGYHWDRMVLEDFDHLPSIQQWCQPGMALLYSMCTHSRNMCVYGRSHKRLLDPQQIKVPRFKWLPKLNEVSKLEDESRWTLFDKMASIPEVPIANATPEQIFNTPGVHKFFKHYGTGIGYILYSINYLVALTSGHRFSLELWEVAALLATSLHQYNAQQRSTFSPKWKKPTMRCITLANWYQYILKLLSRLAVFLQLPAFPEPQSLYSGTYFSSLYVTLKERGKNRSIKSPAYVDPAVIDMLKCVIEENQVLSERERLQCLYELGERPHAEADDGLAGSAIAGAPRVLPIEEHRERILEHIDKYRVTCIQGETGSGKSTKVPLYILKHQEAKRRSNHSIKRTKVIVTQPRRIAAISLAKRVAAELGEESVGNTVGYRVGMDKDDSKDTQLIYATSGYLIELLVHYPDHFHCFTHVILDEIHERTIDNDLLNLIVKILMQRANKQTKIVIMSATLQEKLFLRYFSEHEVNFGPLENHHLFVGVRSPYEVKELYIEDLPDHFKSKLRKDDLVDVLLMYCNYNGISAADLVNQSAEDSDSDDESDSNSKMRRLGASLIKQGALTPGQLGRKTGGRVTSGRYIDLCISLIRACCEPKQSILIFLPGQNEIDEIHDHLVNKQNHIEKTWACALRVFALHSKIPFEDQKDCFNTPEVGTCHVILATNIAESSITLPRVTVILDWGTRRHMSYDTKKRICCLKLDWCSKASLAQRKGRTGRVCDGTVIRMMTKQHYAGRSEFDDPQMRESPLEKLVLQVKHVGKKIANGEKPSELLMKSIQPPDMAHIDIAIKNLADMGAIMYEDELAPETLLGRVAMGLPLDLQLCRLVLFGCLFGCPCDAVVMAAALQVQDPFSWPTAKLMQQEKFVESLRRSGEARRDCDQNTYSEPVMYRNLYKRWLRVAHDNSDRERKKKGLALGRSDVDKDTPTVANLKKWFCEQYNLSNSRFHTLDGFVRDVCQSAASCLSRVSETRDQLMTLRQYIPNQKRQDDEATGPRKYGLEQLFTDDLLQLNTVLAAAMCPKFIMGTVQKENVKKKTENIEGKAREQELEPEKCLYFPSVPEWLLQEEGFKTFRNVVRITCLDVIRPNRGQNRRLQAASSAGIQFTIKPVSRKQAMVQYDVPRRFILKSKEHDITADVHHVLHNVNQFTEVRFTETFNIDLKDDPQAMQKNGDEPSLSIKNPRQPFQIDWELLSFDGATLRRPNGMGCRVFCNWRNPIGFACDTLRRDHFGVTFKFTAQNRGARGFADGSSMFPVYKDNLFSVLLILMFLPQQLQASFKARLEDSHVTHLRVFSYDIELPRSYRLQLQHIEVVNKIRREISRVLTEGEALLHGHIPQSKLENLYAEFFQILKATDELETSEGETASVSEENTKKKKKTKTKAGEEAVCLDAFGGPGEIGAGACYLMPLDERLFEPKALKELLQSLKKVKLTATDATESETESESESESESELEEVEELFDQIPRNRYALLDMLIAKLTAMLEAEQIPTPVATIKRDRNVADIVKMIDHALYSNFTLEAFIINQRELFYLIQAGNNDLLVCSKRSNTVALFQDVSEGRPSYLQRVLTTVLLHLLERKNEPVNITLLERHVAEDMKIVHKHLPRHLTLKQLLEDQNDIFEIQTKRAGDRVCIREEKMQFVNSKGGVVPGDDGGPKWSRQELRIFSFLYEFLKEPGREVSQWQVKHDANFRSLLADYEAAVAHHKTLHDLCKSNRSLVANQDVYGEAMIRMKAIPENALRVEIRKYFRSERAKCVLLGELLIESGIVPVWKGTGMPKRCRSLSHIFAETQEFALLKRHGALYVKDTCDFYTSPPSGGCIEKRASVEGEEPELVYAREWSTAGTEGDCSKNCEEAENDSYAVPAENTTARVAGTKGDSGGVGDKKESGLGEQAASESDQGPAADGKEPRRDSEDTEALTERNDTELNNNDVTAKQKACKTSRSQVNMPAFSNEELLFEYIRKILRHSHAKMMPLLDLGGFVGLKELWMCVKSGQDCQSLAEYLDKSAPFKVVPDANRRYVMYRSKQLRLLCDLPASQFYPCAEILVTEIVQILQQKPKGTMVLENVLTPRAADMWAEVRRHGHGCTKLTDFLSGFGLFKVYARHKVCYIELLDRKVQVTRIPEDEEMPSSLDATYSKIVLYDNLEGRCDRDLVRKVQGKVPPVRSKQRRLRKQLCRDIVKLMQQDEEDDDDVCVTYPCDRDVTHGGVTGNITMIPRSLFDVAKREIDTNRLLPYPDRKSKKRSYAQQKRRTPLQVSYLQTTSNKTAASKSDKRKIKSTAKSQDAEVVKKSKKKNKKKANKRAPPESAQGPAPPESAQGSAPPESAQDSAPPESAQGSAPPESAQGSAPPESAQDSAPPESAQGSAPPESAQGSAPPESAQDSAPPESAQDSAPPESAQGSAPPESAQGMISGEQSPVESNLYPDEVTLLETIQSLVARNHPTPLNMNFLLTDGRIKDLWALVSIQHARTSFEEFLKSSGMFEIDVDMYGGLLVRGRPAINVVGQGHVADRTEYIRSLEQRCQLIPETSRPLIYAAPPGDTGVAVLVSRQMLASGLPVSSQVPVSGLPVRSQMSVLGLPVGSQMSVLGLSVASQMSVSGLPVGSQMSASGLPVGSEMSVSGLPVGSQMPASALPVGSQMPASRLPVGSQMSVSGLPVGSQMPASGLPVGSQMSVSGLPVGSQMPASGLPVGSQMSVSGLPVESEMSVSGLPVGSQMPASGLPVGSQMSVLGLPVRSQMPASGLPVGSQMPASGIPEGSQMSVSGLPVRSQMSVSGFPVASQMSASSEALEADKREENASSGALYAESCQAIKSLTDSIRELFTDPDQSIHCSEILRMPRVQEMWVKVSKSTDYRHMEDFMRDCTVFDLEWSQGNCFVKLSQKGIAQLQRGRDAYVVNESCPSGLSWKPEDQLTEKIRALFITEYQWLRVDDIFKVAEDWNELWRDILIAKPQCTFMSFLRSRDTFEISTFDGVEWVRLRHAHQTPHEKKENFTDSPADVTKETTTRDCGGKQTTSDDSVEQRLVNKIRSLFVDPTMCLEMVKVGTNKEVIECWKEVKSKKNFRILKRFLIASGAFEIEMKRKVPHLRLLPDQSAAKCANSGMWQAGGGLMESTGFTAVRASSENAMSGTLPGAGLSSQDTKASHNSTLHSVNKASGTSSQATTSVTNQMTVHSANQNPSTVVIQQPAVRPKTGLPYVYSYNNDKNESTKQPEASANTSEKPAATVHTFSDVVLEYGVQCPVENLEADTDFPGRQTVEPQPEEDLAKWTATFCNDTLVARITSLLQVSQPRSTIDILTTLNIVQKWPGIVDGVPYQMFVNFLISCDSFLVVKQGMNGKHYVYLKQPLGTKLVANGNRTGSTHASAPAEAEKATKAADVQAVYTLIEKLKAVINKSGGCVNYDALLKSREIMKVWERARQLSRAAKFLDFLKDCSAFCVEKCGPNGVTVRLSAGMTSAGQTRQGSISVANMTSGQLEKQLMAEIRSLFSHPDVFVSTSDIYAIGQIQKLWLELTKKKQCKKFRQFLKQDGVFQVTEMSGKRYVSLAPGAATEKSTALSESGSTIESETSSVTSASGSGYSQGLIRQGGVKSNRTISPEEGLRDLIEGLFTFPEQQIQFGEILKMADILKMWEKVRSRGSFTKFKSFIFAHFAIETIAGVDFVKMRGVCDMLQGNTPNPGLKATDQSQQSGYAKAQKAKTTSNPEESLKELIDRFLTSQNKRVLFGELLKRPDIQKKWKKVKAGGSFSKFKSFVANHFEVETYCDVDFVKVRKARKTSQNSQGIVHNQYSDFKFARSKLASFQSLKASMSKQ